MSIKQGHRNEADTHRFLFFRSTAFQRGAFVYFLVYMFACAVFLLTPEQLPRKQSASRGGFTGSSLHLQKSVAAGDFFPWSPSTITPFGFFILLAPLSATVVKKQPISNRPAFSTLIIRGPPF